MQAKLLAIGGTLRKAEFLLNGGATIGSAEGNTIRLDDPSVSPHHCQVSVVDHRHILTDLDSRSGTFVNGIPVKQRELSAGDEVTLGNLTFLFRTEKPNEAGSSAIQLDEGHEPEAGVQKLRLEELVYLRPESLAALPQSVRLARNLSVLLRVSTAIGSLGDAELKSSPILSHTTASRNLRLRHPPFLLLWKLRLHSPPGYPFDVVTVLDFLRGGGQRENFAKVTRANAATA